MRLLGLVLLLGQNDAEPIDLDRALAANQAAVQAIGNIAVECEVVCQDATGAVIKEMECSYSKTGLFIASRAVVKSSTQDPIYVVAIHTQDKLYYLSGYDFIDKPIITDDKVLNVDASIEARPTYTKAYNPCGYFLLDFSALHAPAKRYLLTDFVREYPSQRVYQENVDGRELICFDFTHEPAVEGGYGRQLIKLDP